MISRPFSKFLFSHIFARNSRADGATMLDNELDLRFFIPVILTPHLSKSVASFKS